MPRQFLTQAPDAPHDYLAPTTGTANNLPVLSWDEAAVQIGRANASWAPTLGAPATVSYAFRATVSPEYYQTYLAGLGTFAQFSAAQIVVAELALQLWADVANITFVRVGTGDSGPEAYSNNATLLFGNFANGPNQFSAFAYLPDPAGADPSAVEGDLWFNAQRPAVQDPASSLYGGGRLLSHEIGHAIGLLHPAAYNGGANSGLTYAANAQHWQDTAMFTNMSYFSETNTGANFGVAAITPMMHDIAAIQRLYGANMTTRTGDTVYGFNSNADRGVFHLSVDGQPATFAIWDAGGIDTLDLSGYTSASEIDLREEAFSSAGSGAGGEAARYNISIARGAVIENAIGGGGGDTIIGNAYANILRGNGGGDVIVGGDGADFLDGGAGVDSLNGEGGDDVIVWDAADVAANINGGAGNDTLLFSIATAPTSFDLVARGFEAAEMSLVDTGGAAWATIRTIFDSAWRNDYQIIVNDDETHSHLDWDQLGVFDWASNYVLYDAGGALDINVTVFDTGVQSAFDFDQANAFAWSSNWNQYAAGGGLDINVTVFDGGSETSNDFDAGDVFDWESNWISLDALGQLDLNNTVFDNGVQSAYDFDQADAFAWSSNWNQYAAGGALDINVTVFDDGSSNSNDFDQNNEFNWSSSFNSYNSASEIDYNIVTFDNGNYAVLDYDQDETFAWSTIWRLYSAGGTLLSEVVTPDGP
ncbi:MAG: M10 family metallopeptidase C-terminal domain-containing protein [Hyphomonadaceae bacterium]|nr:M10 family metallopeptidase C-terminal domain-containing protein [Hyphomonadaceae bacterium]